jgi:hypothetical protein
MSLKAHHMITARLPELQESFLGKNLAKVSCQDDFEVPLYVLVDPRPVGARADRERRVRVRRDDPGLLYPQQSDSQEGRPEARLLHHGPREAGLHRGCERRMSAGGVRDDATPVE